MSTVDPIEAHVRIRSAVETLLIRALCGNPSPSMDAQVERMAFVLRQIGDVRVAVTILMDKIEANGGVVNPEDVTAAVVRSGIPVHDITICRCNSIQPSGDRMVPDSDYLFGAGWTCPFARGVWR